MEIVTDKTLHNGDGLCFLNQEEELIGIRADVAKGNKVSCNRPHGAYRGAQIYRNYDIEWQRQVEASKGNRNIDIELTLEETEEGYVLNGKRKTENEALSVFRSPFSVQKIPATNPEKALENIRKKLSQWGDTIYNPINIDIRLSQPYLIPASVLGELKRQLVAAMASDSRHCEERSDAVIQPDPKQCRLDCHAPLRSARNDASGDTPVIPDEIPAHLMTCHHCIRYANGMCPKVTGKPTGPLYIRNGENIFPLEFDCKNCLMYVCKPE